MSLRVSGSTKADLAGSAACPDRPAPLAYRVGDACAALGIGRTSLYELIRSGKLRVVKVAGRTLVPATELERLVRVD